MKRIIPKYSVIIPLFNKRDTVVGCIRSAARQSVAPVEILVIDDGSTDGGIDAVNEAQIPLVRVISQKNQGVSAARNRGIDEAVGDYIAFLDADDWWDEDFLHHITNLIKHYPGCGIYCTGYWIHRKEGVFLNEHTIRKGGIIKDYFRKAFYLSICWTSALVIPKAVFSDVGNFPEGMKRGQDLYMWTKVAIKYPVSYLPTRLSNYNLLMSENSRSRYNIEEKEYSFMDFYTPGNDDLNEYIARYQIGLGILQSINGYTERSKKVERETSYTRRYRLGWWKLFVLNRLKVSMRKPALDAYKRIAWLLARKGMLE